MSLTEKELAGMLVALVAILVTAHAFGYLFARLRQPRVIGEILGGLLLGPTVFGLLLPAQQAAVFPAEGATAAALGAVYQLGLLLLMFSAGTEVRSVFRQGERKTAASITVAGTAMPFAIGVAVLGLVDLERFHGPAGSPAAFLLVFGIAMAVTSIPVISRIMHDLGILATPFARIVLAAAVLEDIPLYVLLAIALGLAHAGAGEAFGLPTVLGFEPGGEAAVAYHVVATLAFFGAVLAFGARAFRALVGLRWNVVNRGSPLAFQLVFLLLVTAVSALLGVPPLFGALVAGMAASAASEDPEQAREAIRSFSFAFFIPVYFAIVGLKLDLVHSFDPLFFLGFLGLACAAKALSVYGGARLAGEGPRSARNLAVAMNARGGPGIVLASVAFDAGIIDDHFYTALVLLAVVTSMAAGSWLERVVRSGQELRETEPQSLRSRLPGEDRRKKASAGAVAQV